MLSLKGKAHRLKYLRRLLETELPAGEAALLGVRTCFPRWKVLKHAGWGGFGN